MSLRIGELISMTTFVAVSGKNKFTFKTGDKSKRFVFVLLGVEEDGKPFDDRAALASIGYVPDAELAKEQP